MTTAIETKALSEVKTGDRVWIDIKFPSWNGPADTALYTIYHVDKRGRLYIAEESLWDQWRYGFDPETGTAQHYNGYKMRYASPEEVSAELGRKDAAKKAEAEQQAADKRAEQIRAAAADMLKALERIDALDPKGIACRDNCSCMGCIARAAIRTARGE